MAKIQTKERPRGRPKAADSLSVDVILAVALEQFATLG